MSNLKLGDEVVDTITGFSGTITTMVTYVGASDRVYVQPLMQDYGSMPPEVCVDVGRLRLKNAEEQQNKLKVIK